MAKLDEKQKERLRTATVEVLLELRRAYLSTDAGRKNYRKNWEVLIARARSAAKTTESPAEWFTCMLRKLQIPTVSLGNSSCSIDLVQAVTEMDCRTAWLDLVEQEYGLLFALARDVAEKRAIDKDAEKEAERGTETV